MRIPEILVSLNQIIGPEIASRWDFLADPYSVKVIVHDSSIVAMKVARDGRGFRDEKFENDMNSGLKELFPSVRDILVQSELLTRRRCHISVRGELTVGALSLRAEAATGNGSMSIQTDSAIPFLMPFIVDIDTTMVLALDVDKREGAHIIDTFGKQAISYCAKNGKLAGDAPPAEEVLAWENECRGRYDLPSQNWKCAEWLAPTYLRMKSKTELDR